MINMMMRGRRWSLKSHGGPWRAMEGSKSKAILDGKDIYPPVFSNMAIGNSLEMEV